jgi:hypothetical protein
MAKQANKKGLIQPDTRILTFWSGVYHHLTARFNKQRASPRCELVEFVSPFMFINHSKRASSGGRLQFVVGRG